MPLKISAKTMNDQLRHKIDEIAGDAVARCMQCGTCSASCPMNTQATSAPRHVMHLIQFGQAEELKKSNMAWLCASCHTCEVRCPRGIDIPAVMEALRQVQLRDNVDKVGPAEMKPEDTIDLPTIAMVAGFRKLSS
ncbi:MAG: 4Fe-4S dicluster domain-containing protein [candidate division Zixibacteria bacterium]|nr:4Fe-4S dicluster domain-containing protein [candidate division Zixibacteria bacterium]